MERQAQGVLLLVALVTWFWVQLAGGVVGPLPNNAQGLAIDFQSGAVYVSDPVHHCVVRYQSVYDLASGIAIGGGLLAQPIGLWIDQGTLYVADYLNQTVKIWTNALNATNQTLPYAVIGGPGTKGTRLIPWAVRVYNSSLFVADTGNGRVLRFDGVPGSLLSDTTASAIIPIQGNPQGVFASASGLFVSVPSKVFIFSIEEAFATPSATPHYYGESSFATSATGMNSPLGIAATADGALFVADSNNYRVVLFQGYPTTNSPSASAVFGAPNFNVLGTLVGVSAVSYDPQTNTLWALVSNLNSLVNYTDALLGIPNAPSLDVGLQFLGNSPHVYIYPKDTAGNINSNINLLVQALEIQEVASNGSVVNSIPFPQLGYKVSQSQTSNGGYIFRFSAFLVAANALTSGEIELTYSVFSGNQTLNSAGISFELLPSVLKLEFLLSNWSLEQSANTLNIIFRLEGHPNFTSQQSSATAPGITSFTLSSSTVLSTTINMLSNGVVDGTTNTAINFSLTQENGFKLVMRLPHFANSFQYDPDFGVALGTSGSDGGDGSSSLLPLLALLALVIVPLALFLIVALIVVVIYARKWRLNHQDTETRDEVVNI